MKKLEPVDVVVVGAGMGGAAFSFRLSERQPDLRIVCLERGPWVKPAAMPTDKPGFQRQMRSNWSPSPNVRLASPGSSPTADYPIDDADSPIKPLLWNAVGGSTIAWAAHFPRLHRSDFELFSRDGVADDWPFSYDELAPYYDVNDAMMGVCGRSGDPAYPDKKSPRLPPLPLGRMGRKARAGFDSLGWHWWPVDAAINTVPYRERPACNYCGPCQQGCIHHAKASVDRTYWPYAQEQGVALRPESIVQEIVVEGGEATGVRYRSADGQTWFQPAAYVAVAGNGIGTPRLLLASGIGGEMVGRCLMFHPVGYIRAICDERLDGPAGPIGACLYSHEFYETDRTRGFVRGLQLQVTRENPLLVQSAYFAPRWGREAQRQLRREFGHSFRVLIMAEDLPERHNRVGVTGAAEADGLPGVKLHYTLSENSRRILEFGAARGEEMLRAAGVPHMVTTVLAPGTGWHLLGTARMGRDPATSVTDGRGRVHTHPNVLVVDGSLFPTVGAVNPASTIGAVALKIADELAADLG